MAAERTYLAEAGEALDLIVLAHYGRTDGVIEAVLAANPGLAAEGPTLAARRLLILPAVSAPAPRPTRRLWG